MGTHSRAPLGTFPYTPDQGGMGMRLAEPRRICRLESRFFGQQSRRHCWLVHFLTFKTGM
jgi:hypothetical protein